MRRMVKCHLGEKKATFWGQHILSNINAHFGCFYCPNLGMKPLWNQPMVQQKIATQTCTIHRGVWNLPHKFHLYFIFKLKQIRFLLPLFIPWNLLTSVKVSGQRAAFESIVINLFSQICLVDHFLDQKNPFFKLRMINVPNIFPGRLFPSGTDQIKFLSLDGVK